MFLKVKIRHIFFLSFIIIDHGLVHEFKWVNHLVKYIQDDLRNSQAVFIIDDNFDNQTIKIENILRKVQSNFPSQVISLQNATPSEAGILKQEQVSQDLQSTTLFIAILFLNNNLQNSSFSEATEFLIEISAHQIRPKCLMIVVPREKGLSFKELLQNMWSKNFLDITILEVIDKRSENNYSLWNHHKNIAMIHCLNPFTGIYSRKSYGEKIKLFPNILRDLNGFEMKIGSFNYPPYAKVKRNATGHPISVSGPDASVVKAVSEAMNFTISEGPAEKDSWGRSECGNPKIATGFFRQLQHNEIRLTTNQGIIAYNCSVEFSRSTGLARFSALILKSKENKHSLSLSMKWLYLVLLIVPIWLMTRLLKFDPYYWSLIDIIQAMLGFTVPREPQRSAEKIVFATLLIAFSVFSSTLFAIITDIERTENADVVIDTLEELNKSNLVPVMQEIFYNLLKAGSDHITETLLNKSRIDVSREECIEMLLDHQKVACIDRESTSEMFIQSHLAEDGQPVMEIVKETFGHHEKGMLFEKNSPFVRAVDKILIKLLESGIYNLWHKRLSSSLIKSEESIMKEEQESANLIIPLLIVLATGYGLSIVVFMIELLREYVEKLAFRCIEFIRPGSSF